MLKSEQKFHTEAVKWIKYHKNLLPQSFLMETKVVRYGKNSFPFSELSPKEERLLLKAKHSTLIQTHSDYSRLGTNCDGSIISGGGLIFIKWMRRGNKRFYIIDIDNFIKKRDSLKRKSLTEEEAKSISLDFASEVGVVIDI